MLEVDIVNFTVLSYLYSELTEYYINDTQIPF